MRRAAFRLLLLVCALGPCACSAYDNIGAHMKNDPAFDFPSTLRTSKTSSSPSGSASSSLSER